jgi:transient receptor potential cation channel subfamily A protein 1
MRACHNGHSKCVQLLHKTHPFQRDWSDKKGNTALHYAALSGDPETLHTALDIGCKITNNHEGLSFLNIVIASANERCGLVVVNHARWQECLDFPSQFNPVIGLIQQLPSVAKCVLDRCHQCAPCGKKHAEYWEKFDFKYLQPLKFPSEEEDESISTSLVLEKVNREKSNSMTALHKMVKYKRLDLLVHPVVKKYLTYKWNTYGIWVYLVSFILRITVAIFLSAFILVVPNPNIVQSQINNSHDDNGTSSGEISLSVSAQALRATTLGINIFLSLIILMPLVATIKKLFTSDNFPILVYALSILCIYVFLLAPNPTAIWTFGAVASFFAWLAVIMGLLFFKLFGIYVKMFLTVITTVFKVLVVSGFLILAFAFPFYILAGPLPPFASIGYSLFTLFSYMLGEIQYEFIILEDQRGSLNHSPVIFLFVIVVAILMTIAMGNLLVGLAVGDIEGIRSTAFLEKRKLHVLYLSHLERSPFFRRFHKPYIISYPNRKPPLLKRVWNYFRSIIAEEEVEEMKPASNLVNMINCDHTNCCQREEIIRLGQQLEELSLLVKQLCEQQKGGK